ncbi:MFS transporter [Nocardioides coralli]|uniref:MFS transporter n=1 Tax=Nocardioides coralli TaxID=2872154 RepID=UPI001CA454EF|nr:MFS transporter [Nocardioides coralli]QZY30308.1 MFS transporter [Nocardioides coralli]
MAEVQDTADEPARPGGRATGTRATLRTVASNADLRRIQLAFLGSSVGDWAYATAIVVWAYAEGGAAVVGAWMGVRFLLGALTTPLGAVLADRWPRRRVMLLADLTRAVLVTAVAVLVAVDGSVLLVLVLSTLVSVLTSPFLIAQRALLPALSRTPAELTAANGIHSTIDSLAYFLGPALAAGLLVATDVPVVLALNVATFLWSMMLVARVRVVQVGEPITGSDGDEPDAESFVSEILAGFRLLRTNRDLLLCTIQVCAQTVVMGASSVFLVVMAAELLRSGDAGLGYLNAVIGIGSVFGGLVAIARADRGTLGRDMVAGVVLWSAPLLLVTASPTAAACFLAAALLGLANPLVDVNLDTIFQRLTPDELLGRAFGALESCVIATAAIGAFAMPLLLDLLGLRWALAAVALPVTVVALLGLPAMNRMDGRLSAPAGLDLLRSLDLFAPLDPGTTEQLASRLVPVVFTAGETLVREGEESDRFFVIESGLVEVTQGERVLRTEGPGEYVGEIGLLRDVPRTATVTAVEDTRALTLSREDFLRAVSGHRESRLTAEAVVKRRLAG